MSTFSSDEGPLTGTLNGTNGDDAYVGNNAVNSNLAIYKATIFDLLGKSDIQASSKGTWASIAISESNIKLGDSYQHIVADVWGKDFEAGIFNSYIELLY